MSGCVKNKERFKHRKRKIDYNRDLITSSTSKKHFQLLIEFTADSTAFLQN